MLNSDFKLVLKLKPLVQGLVLYKKFSLRQSLNMQAKAFDPLQADVTPPELCGYGLRVLQFDIASCSIKIRQSHKQTAEMSINVKEIIKPIIPPITLDILKEKQSKHNRISSHTKAGSEI